MMTSLSVSVMYVYKYFSKALSLEGKVKSTFKGPSATQSWSEGKSSKGAATFHFMVDKTSSCSLINDTGKQNDSLPVFSFLSFLFFSLLGWTVQKCFHRPQRKTLCDCKRLLYEALKLSHPHTLDPAEQENKALFWKWFLNLNNHQVIWQEKALTSPVGKGMYYFWICASIWISDNIISFLSFNTLKRINHPFRNE